MTRPGFEADRFRIVLLSLADGRSRVLTEAWDRSPGDLFFSPDGKTLYGTAMDVGHVGLFAIDVASGKVSPLVHQGSVHAPAWATGGTAPRLVFGLDSLTAPVDLYTCRPDGADLKKLTERQPGRARRRADGRAAGLPVRRRQGRHGARLHRQAGGFDPAKRYPVAYLSTAVPQGSFHDEFHYRWNPQPYAGAGYAVVEVDFHGSTGYGQAFHRRHLRPLGRLAASRTCRRGSPPPSPPTPGWTATGSAL